VPTVKGRELERALKVLTRLTISAGTTTIVAVGGSEEPWLSIGYLGSIMQFFLNSGEPFWYSNVFEIDQTDLNPGKEMPQVLSTILVPFTICLPFVYHFLGLTD
jgi:hypothetical protein